MARPRKQSPKKPVKLTLDPKLRDAADAYAFANNRSLSELVEELLRARITPTAQTPTHSHDRPTRIHRPAQGGENKQAKGA